MRCVTGAASENSIHAILEQPDFRMVVRLRRGNCDPQTQPARGNHPREAVQCVTAQGRRFCPSVHEHVGNQLRCLLCRHLGPELHGGSFFREKGRCYREVDGCRRLVIDVLGESRSQSPYPPGCEPPKGAADTLGGPKSRYQNHRGHGLVGQSEQARSKRGFIAQHGYSARRRFFIRASIVSA